MLFYVRCPSCGEVISYDFDKYTEDVEAIALDPKLKPMEKELARAKLLDKYGITNLCCRIRLIGLIPYHKIIV